MIHMIVVLGIVGGYFLALISPEEIKASQKYFRLLFKIAVGISIAVCGIFYLDRLFVIGIFTGVLIGLLAGFLIGYYAKWWMIFFQIVFLYILSGNHLIVYSTMLLIETFLLVGMDAKNYAQEDKIKKGFQGYLIKKYFLIILIGFILDLITTFLF